MSERERLEHLTESLLEIERRHPGIPKAQRSRLTARLALSIGDEAPGSALQPQIQVPTVRAAHPDSAPQLAASADVADIRRIEERPERIQAEQDAAPSWRPWIPLSAFLRAAAALIALASPWALAAGIGVVTIAGVGAWTIHRGTQRTRTTQAVTPPGPTVRAISANPPPAPPSLVPASQPAAIAPSESRRPSPPSAQTHLIVPPPVVGHPQGDRPDETLLESARAALNAGDATAALSLLDQHRLQHPGSQLLEEREVLRAEALLASGQGVAARLSANAFIISHPDSLLVPRARAILGPDQKDDP